MWNNQWNRIITENEISGLIPDGKNITPSLLGFDHFAADLYWIKTIQYVGGNVRAKKPALYNFANLITTIDPNFTKAYKLAILLLPDGGLLDETEKLIQKSEQENPENWEALFQAGFFYYYYKEDNEKALEYYEKCTRIKGCLGGAKRMIKNIQTRAGKYEVAIEQRLTDLFNPEISDEEYELTKKKIKEAADLLLLNDAAKQYAQKKGEDITALENLIGFSFSPKNKNILPLLEKISPKLEYNYQISGQYFTVTKETITAAFETNKYEWDAENKKVRTRIF